MESARFGRASVDGTDVGSVGGIVVAAGTGSRLGAERPKALLEIAGLTLVARSVRILLEAGLSPPVVVHAPGWRADFAAALEGESVAALVPGGETRTASVRAGLTALPATDLVAVHDAARPLVPVDVVQRVLAAVTGNVLAAAPAMPVVDTLKRVVDDRVVATVDRGGLVGVQTPQAFPRHVLEAVLTLEESATDELALVERWIDEGGLTGSVVVVTGSPLAHKITYADDLRVVTALARADDEAAR